MPIFARVTAFSFVVFVVFIPKVYSEQSLIKDTSPISEMPQLDAVESMLRNYQGILSPLRCALQLIVD